MKLQQKYFILFVLFGLLSGCNKDDEESESPNYGAEFFECKINGEPFQAVSDFTCSGPRFDYYPESFMSVPKGYMLLAGKDCAESPLCAIRIYGYNNTLGDINFEKPGSAANSISPFYSYFDNSNPDVFLFEQLISGSVDIEQLIPRADGNSPLGTISGTFEFVVTDDMSKDTIRVTEGRFRFDVPQIF